MKYALVLAAMLSASSFAAEMNPLAAKPSNKPEYTCKNKNESFEVKVLDARDPKGDIVVTYHMGLKWTGTLSVTQAFKPIKRVVAIDYSGMIGPRCAPRVPCPKVVKQKDITLFRDQTTGLVKQAEDGKKQYTCTLN